ncbi:MAG TPA: hypothetical protein VFI73_06405 [Candidatus Nitrosopolaris sp.]|nr:hypothetical protein [Candidatus Nitrosopolaris sp.]
MNVRLMLHDIERFSKASHPIYKRFKHAGISIFSNAVQKTPPSGPLSIFEVFNLVADGPDPVRDIVIIPYSKHVLKRYEKIIDKLQTLLLEMTENRIICLEISLV